MNPSPQNYARLALLVLVTVILQVSGVASLQLFGASPDLVPNGPRAAPWGTEAPEVTLAVEV